MLAALHPSVSYQSATITGGGGGGLWTGPIVKLSIIHQLSLAGDERRCGPLTFDLPPDADIIITTGRTVDQNGRVDRPTKARLKFIEHVSTARSGSRVIRTVNNKRVVTK